MIATDGGQLTKDHSGRTSSGRSGCMSCLVITMFLFGFIMVAPTVARDLASALDKLNKSKAVVAQPTPTETAVFMELLDTYWANGEWYKVIRVLEEHGEHSDPANHEKLYAAYVNYGTVLSIEGKNGAAGIYLTKAIELDPSRPEAVQSARSLTPTPTPKPTPTPTFDEIKSTAKPLSYDDLFRNNSAHIGDLVYYRAEIIQVLDGGSDRYTLRANVTEGRFAWSDTVYLVYYGPRLLENDIVDLIGRVSGLKAYDAIFGQKITIPEIAVMNARVVVKAGDRK